MTIKRALLILMILLVILAGIWLGVHYFGATRQIYEGVLV